MQQEVVVKRAFLAENFDLIIEAVNVETKEPVKWLIKKETYKFNGRSIEHEMNVLKDIWATKFVGKKVKVNLVTDDELYCQSSSTEELLDPSMRTGMEEVDYDDDFSTLQQELLDIIIENKRNADKNLKRYEKKDEKIERLLEENFDENDTEEQEGRKFFF